MAYLNYKIKKSTSKTIAKITPMNIAMSMKKSLRWTQNHKNKKSRQKPRTPKKLTKIKKKLPKRKKKMQTKDLHVMRMLIELIHFLY